MGIRLQDRAELKEFQQTVTVETGTENRTEVLQRLGLVTETKKVSKYVMRNGVPHKHVNGTWVPLKKQ